MMDRHLKRHLLLCALLLLATLGATLALHARLPPEIALHWNAAGQADRYGPRAALFIPLAVMAALMLLWAVLPRVSPRGFSVADFDATYWYLGLLVAALLAYIQMLQLWGAWSPKAGVLRALLGGLAVFMALTGNVLGKVRRNFWIGIRTPWTLASERVWYSTHRLAARTMFGTALLALAAVAAALPALVCLGLLGAGLLVPLAYSLWYYKRLERSGNLET